MTPTASRPASIGDRINLVRLGPPVCSDERISTMFGTCCPKSMVVWAVFVAIQRLDSVRAFRKGRIIHSRYAGDSWLASKGSPKTRRKTMQMLMEPLMCLIAGVLNCRQLRAWAREKGCERKSQQPSRIVEFRKTALGRARTYNPRFRRRGSIAFLASKSEKRERTVTLKYTENQGNLCRDTELACWPLHNFEAAEVHSHTAPKAKS
jgi:hypothetical protein